MVMPGGLNLSWLALKRLEQPGTVMSDSKKILVAGDSHSVILGANVLGRDPSSVSQLPGVDVLHLGPSLAYTLPMQSSLNAGGKLLGYLLTNPDRYDAVMLCFGEIDARAHLIKQAVLQGITLSAVVDKLVDQYFRYVDLLTARTGLPVFIWGPVGSMPDGADFYNPDFPTVGCERERNHATVLFNRQLAWRCDAHPMAHYVSISDRLIDEDLCTRSEFYEDGVHLNRKGMHLAFREIRKRFSELGFSDLVERFPEQIYVANQPRLRNVAPEARIIEISSMLDKDWRLPRSLGNPGNLPFVFHTHQEDHPRVLVDMGCVQMVERIEIFNRLDGFAERARSLKVGISTNPYTFETVFDNVKRQPFGADRTPLILHFDRPAHFRYLHLSLQEREFFHLGDVRIWAKSFLQPVR